MKYSVTVTVTDQKLVIDMEVPDSQKAMSAMELEQRELTARTSFAVESFKDYCRQFKKPYELNINGKYMLTSTSDPSN